MTGSPAPARETQPGDARHLATVALELTTGAPGRDVEALAEQVRRAARAVLALPPTGDAVALRTLLEQWVATDWSLGPPMRAFDAGYNGPIWTEQELQIQRDMGIEGPPSDTTASARDRRNWNGVKAVLRAALAASGGSREKLMQALADARAAYSTGGIEGASGLIKRLFDVFDEVGE